jgi:hypothetical protein
VDEVEKIISRLNGIDPTRPYFDPLAVEEAIRRHARLIGFRDVSFTWAMGPRQAADALADVDFEGPEAQKWQRAMQRLEDQARSELQRDQETWHAYCHAQSEAEARLGDALHLELFEMGVMDLLPQGTGYSISSLVGADASYSIHAMAHLVSAALRDLIASAAVESESLQDKNEAYLPFTDAMVAGLGSFWTVGETFVCLPLPRLTLKDGRLLGDGSPAAVWPNGEAYAVGEKGLVSLQPASF